VPLLMVSVLNLPDSKFSAFEVEKTWSFFEKLFLLFFFGPANLLEFDLA